MRIPAILVCALGIIGTIGELKASPLVVYRGFERGPFSVNSDGTAMRQIAYGGPAALGYGIGVNALNGDVYWGDYDAGIIYVSKYDGSGTTALMTGLNVSVPFGNPIYDFEIDNNNNRFYFTQNGVGLRSATLAGADLQTLVSSSFAFEVERAPSGDLTYWSDASAGSIKRTSTEGATTTLFSSSTSVRGMAIDWVAGKIYWADTGSSPSTSKILRGNLDGTGAETLYTGVGAIGSLDLDVAEGRLYWGDEIGSIKSAAMNGGGAITSMDPTVVAYGLKVAAIPEPTTMAFFGVAGGLLLTRRFRRQSTLK